MASPACIIRHADQSDIWLLSDNLRPLLTSHHTGNALAVAVSRLHPGSGPPPHVHEREDEGFYILEGELTLLAGEKLIVARPGDFVWAPRNVVHTFKCTSPGPAKMLLLVAPTEFLNFAMTLAEPAPDFHRPPVLTPEKMGQLMAVAPQYGITMLPEHPMPTTIVHAAAASKRLWVMGEHVSYLATAAQTGGQFTIVEIRSAPAGGPPPHVHTKEDEILYVLEGEHEIRLGDRTEIAGAGDMVYVPHGTRHRYKNIEPSPGRLLSIHMPGGFEAFFDECGVDAAGHATAPQTPAVSHDALEALLARHGMTF